MKFKISDEPTRFDAGDVDVAEGHDASGVRDISAHRKGELATDWLQVPPASGAECARALRRAGLLVRSQTSQICTLVGRRGLLVSVPLVDCLPPDWLVAILRTAGVSPAQFTRYLDELSA